MEREDVGEVVVENLGNTRTRIIAVSCVLGGPGSRGKNGTKMV